MRVGGGLQEEDRIEDGYGNIYMWRIAILNL